MMQIIIVSCAVLLLSANILGGYWLWRRFKRLQRASTELHETIAALDPNNAALPANIAKVLGHGKRRVLCIEILNPVELAVEKNRLAGPLSGIAPEFINQQVYQQTRDILLEKLREFGVQAEVTIQEIR